MIVTFDGSVLVACINIYGKFPDASKIGQPYSRNSGNSSFQNLHLSFSLILPTLVLKGAVFNTK